jgi:hypothetical protein
MTFLNFFYFCWSFLPSWIRIRIPNPDTDPLTWIESGSETLVLKLQHVEIQYLNPICPRQLRAEVTRRRAARARRWWRPPLPCTRSLLTCRAPRGVAAPARSPAPRISCWKKGAGLVRVRPPHNCRTFSARRCRSGRLQAGMRIFCRCAGGRWCFFGAVFGSRSIESLSRLFAKA